MDSNERPALFISHATPEDNPFTIWLGAKLSALGYEVWADVMRLRGGDDWQRKLEGALRYRARKVLLVANPAAVEKQGVRNEIQIASDVARKIGDKEFIIPLRLAPFDAPFLIAHAQYIDFSRGWSRGLSELLETLDETYQIPRNETEGTEVWRAIQLLHAREVIAEPETLISNWVAIDNLPKQVRFYDFKSGISLGRAKTAIRSCPRPTIPFNRGFLSFTPIDELQDHFGPELPLVLMRERSTDEFIRTGWRKLEIEPWTARNHFSDLTRQAIEQFFSSRGLTGSELADKRLAWWAPQNIAPTNKVSFKWRDISGLRQIQGASSKRKMQWHFGVTVTPRIMPLPHVRMTSRLIFTQDGHTTYDPARMHRLRRSFAKSWRNARWRDMLLAFLHWLAEGKTELMIPTSFEEGIILRLPPMTFTSPVSVPPENEDADDDDPSDDDGPDIFEDGDEDAVELEADE